MRQLNVEGLWWLPPQLQVWACMWSGWLTLNDQSIVGTGKVYA